MSSVLKKYDLSSKDSIVLGRSPPSSHRCIKSDLTHFPNQNQQINQHQKQEVEPPPSKKPCPVYLEHIIIAATLFEAVSYLLNGILYESLERFISGIIGFVTLILVCVHYVASRKNINKKTKKFKLLIACMMLLMWTTSLLNARGDQQLNMFLFIPLLSFKTILFIHYSVSFIIILTMLGAVTIFGIVLNILLYQNRTAFEYADGVLFFVFTIPFLLNMRKPKKKIEKTIVPPPPPEEPQFDEKVFNTLHVLDEAVVIVDMLGQPVYSNAAFEKMFPNPKEEDLLASNRESNQTRPSLAVHFQKISGLKAKEHELHGKIADVLKTDQTITPGQNDSLMRRVLRSTGSPDSLLVLDRESGLHNLYITLLNSERQLKSNDIAFDSQSKLPKFESFTGIYRKGLKDSVDIELNLSYLEFGAKNYLCFIFHTNQYQAELKAAQKESDFRKQMLRYVAHDMRNPLSSNQLLLEAAEGDAELSAKMKELYVKPCLKSLKFLFALVNDLVDSAQLAAGKFKLVITEVYLPDIMDEVIRLFDIKAKAKDITLNKMLDPRLPLTIFTDAARLTQVLINLLSNALKYTPRKGAITIKVDPNILNSHKVDFSVEDTGIGIRMEDQKDLLKDFGKVEGSKDPELNPYGVGLGLSISNKLAAQLNVEGMQEGIKIDSVVGKGTKMKFSVENRKSDSNLSRMPSAAMLTPANVNSKKPSENISSSLEESRHSSSHNSSIEIRPLPGRTKSGPKVKKTLSFLRKIHEEDILKPQENHGKAFIIDDDAFSAESLALLLRSLGVSADKAYNTKDALKKLVAPLDSNSGTQFGYDVLFVDGMMDDMDGFESSKLLKEKMRKGEVKEAPIVFCTGLDAESEAQARESGASFYATKPINKGFLTNILKELKLGNLPNSATHP